MKKLFALMIAVVLLAGAMRVYAEGTVEIPGKKGQQPAPPVEIPGVKAPGTSISERQQPQVEYVINYDDGTTAKGAMPAVFFDKISQGGQIVKGVYFDADRNLIDRAGNKWSGFGTSTYTATKDDKIVGSFKFGRSGYIQIFYDDGKPTSFEGRGIGEKERSFLEIPASYERFIDINAKDFSFDGKEYHYNGLTATFDSDRTLIESKDDKIVSIKSSNPSTGVTVTMNSEGDIEIRDADGSRVESFTGEYKNGVYTDKDGRYNFDISSSELSDKTQGSTITYMPNGDVVYKAPNAETIRHKNGDTTSGYFEEGKLSYSERINKEGWIISWTDDSSGDVYIANDDGSISMYKGIDINSATGKPMEGAPSYHYAKEDINTAPDIVKKLYDANELNRFWTGRGAISEFIGTYIMGLTDYRALSNALIKGKDYQKWQEDVDKFFARAYLGVDYWASAICRKDFHSTGNKGFAVIETPTGLMQFIGHVEAEKSAPIPKECPCAKDETCKGRICYKGSNMQVEFFYKITYGVTAPSDLKLTPQRKEGSAVSFSIQMSGEKQAWLFVKKGTDVPHFYELQNGQSQNAVSDKAVVFYSPTDYSGICIYFREKPEDVLRGMVDKICNIIPQSQSSYLNWKASKSSGTGVPAEGGTPEAGFEINPEI